VNEEPDLLAARGQAGAEPSSDASGADDDGASEADAPERPEETPGPAVPDRPEPQEPAEAPVEVTSGDDAG